MSSLPPLAIAQPFPYSEREFWLKVRRRINRSRDLIEAAEKVRDADGIHQIHIAGLMTHIGYTCWYRYQMLPPFAARKYGKGVYRDIINAHLEKL